MLLSHEKCLSILIKLLPLLLVLALVLKLMSSIRTSLGATARNIDSYAATDVCASLIGALFGESRC